MSDNEYRVIGPPGCISGDAIVGVNRMKPWVGGKGTTKVMRLDELVRKFTEAVPGGFRSGYGSAATPGVSHWDSKSITRVRCMRGDGSIGLAPLVRAMRSGSRNVLLIKTSSGESVKATPDHVFYNNNGEVAASDIVPGITSVFIDAGKGALNSRPKKRAYHLLVSGLLHHPNRNRVGCGRSSLPVHRLVVEAYINGVEISDYVRAHRTGNGMSPDWIYLDPKLNVHHKDENKKNNSIENLEVLTKFEHSTRHGIEGKWKHVSHGVSESLVTSVEPLGLVETYDLTVYLDDGCHGNFIANGFAVRNCGKTYYLAEQTKQRLESWKQRTGLLASQCSDILICSMTKAAAAEIGGRSGELPSEQVGTLHSHALHALGRPKLCVSPKAIAQWNSESSMDHWLSGGATTREEDGFSVGVGKYRGDALNTEYTINRCKLIPREMWSEDVLNFAKAYERWKFLHSFFDYEDLIEKAFLDKTDPPGNPSTILGDEQQDSSLSDLRLMRYWGRKASKLILVGDTDQAIFGFRGADPEGFYATEIPDGHTKVLEQSHRLPRSVHEVAMRMITRIPERKPIVYHPRPEEGEVTKASYSLRSDPFDAVREIERILKEPDTAPDRPKVMVLFACSYMASPFTTALRQAGIPYWNPYAGERGNFNPLHPGNGVSTLERILNFLKPSDDCYGEDAKVWTWSQLHSWVEMCSGEGWLRHGAKTRIKHQASTRPHDRLTVDDLDGLVAGDGVMAELSECNLDFLGRHLAEAKRNTYDFVVDVVRKRGYTDLRRNPRVVVSTAHGAKGTEADHVFVCPDLSVSGWDTFGNRQTRDSVFRLFYVALTRARHRLILTAPLNQQAVSW